MAATLADLLNQRRTIPVNVLGHELQVTYRPGYLTPKTNAQNRKLAEQADDEEATIRTFVGLVESWDLQGENGKPVPITMEALQGVPFSVLNLVSNRCFEDMQPGKRK